MCALNLKLTRVFEYNLLIIIDTKLVAEIGVCDILIYLNDSSTGVRFAKFVFKIHLVSHVIAHQLLLLITSVCLPQLIGFLTGLLNPRSLIPLHCVSTYHSRSTASFYTAPPLNIFGR